MRRQEVIQSWLAKDRPITELLGLKPEDGTGLTRLAAAFHVAEDFPAAEAAADLATQCLPDLFEAWALLGAARARQKKIIEAEPAYERAVRLRPNDITTLTDLGEVEIQLMAYEKAADYLRRALELDPEAKHPSGRRARAVIGRTLALLRTSK